MMRAALCVVWRRVTADLRQAGRDVRGVHAADGARRVSKHQQQLPQVSQQYLPPHTVSALMLYFSLRR